LKVTPEFREQLIERIGYYFAALVSHNNQPHMSGDPRNRLSPHVRRRFDDTCEELADYFITILEVEDAS
jgi:hypothetical protein